MARELYELYISALKYGHKYRLDKVYKNMYHVYWVRTNGSVDGVPQVLMPKGASFKECRCCKWKPEEEYL